LAGVDVWEVDEGKTLLEVELPPVADLFYRGRLAFARGLLEIPFKELLLRFFRTWSQKIELGTLTYGSIDADGIVVEVERSLRTDLIQAAGRLCRR
jgi:hypothetical protein